MDDSFTLIGSWITLVVCVRNLDLILMTLARWFDLVFEVTLLLLGTGLTLKSKHKLNLPKTLIHTVTQKYWTESMKLMLQKNSLMFFIENNLRFLNSELIVLVILRNWRIWKSQSSENLLEMCDFCTFTCVGKAKTDKSRLLKYCCWPVSDKVNPDVNTIKIFFKGIFIVLRQKI